MNILIIGSGSYVLGDQYGPGVVLRSVLQWLKLDYSLDFGMPKVWLTYQDESSVQTKRQYIDDLCGTFLSDKRGVDIELLHISDLNRATSRNSVDACFVCTPDMYHGKFIERCVQKGWPVWVVKPLCGDLAAATALSDVITTSAPKVWVDYHKRFDSSNTYLKLIKNSKKHGDLLAYSVDYHQPRDLPLSTFSWAKDVDVFTYIGCHYVDQIFYLFPEAELSSVAALGIRGEVYEECGQFDGVLMQSKFETNSGVLSCHMNVGWFNPLGSAAKSLQTVKAQFRNGLVELDQTRRGLTVWHDDGVALVNPYFFGETLSLEGEVKYDGYGYDSIRHFLDLVLSGDEWPDNDIIPTLQQALKTERVLDAVKSATVA